MWPAPSVPITTPSGSVASAARASAPSSPDVVGMMKTRLSSAGRVERRVARDLRPDRRMPLGDAAERAHLRRGERRQRRRVGLAHDAGVVDLAAEDDEHAQAGGVVAGGDRDGVHEVRRAVGARGGGGPDRAGEDDGRLGVADDVAEHRRLLERVGAVRDDDADAAPRGVAGGAADLELLVEGQVGAREVGDRLRLEALVAGEPGTAAISACASSSGRAPPAPFMPIVPPAPMTRTRRAGGRL